MVGKNDEVSVSVIAPDSQPVSVVVPALNEAATIARVIKVLLAMPLIDEVVVVDNGSTDDTAAIAVAAGARVVSEAQPGMGHAIRTGFIAARNNWVMKVDADLDKFDISLFARMIAARAPGIGLVKGMWQDPRDNMPMTRLLVIPALRLMFPGLGELKASNSGIYIFDSSLIALQEIVGEYSADLDVLVRVYAAGAGVTEVDIGRIDNNPRNVSHYNAMAEVIMDLFLRLRDARITEEMVVLADNATEVVSGCLGVLAAHSRAGGRVSVYLGDTESKCAGILRDALKPFPTARIDALSLAATFRPSDNAVGARLFAPYPIAGRGEAFDTACALLKGPVPKGVTELLLMAPTGDAAPRGFAVDTSLSAARGNDIKQAALHRIGLDTGLALPREVFQQYVPV